MATKAKVSKRDLLKADGSEADNMNDATGGRYTLVDNGKGVDYQFGANQHLDRFFAIFGFATKIGNVANTILNDAKDPGTVDDAYAEIVDFMESAGQGIWREASEGGTRGPKYDKDVLADCIAAQPNAKGDAAHYRAKLDDKSYYAKVRAVTDIMAAYHTEMAKRGKATSASVDSVL